jgi:hypothetical protein
MIKKLFIYLTLILLTNSCAINKQVFLKGGIQPNMNYTVESHEVMQSMTKLIGPDEVVEVFKNNGMEFPLIENGNLYQNSKTITGSKNDSNTYPFSISYQLIRYELEKNGKKTTEDLPLSGTTVKGFINQANRLIVDTIISVNQNNRLKPIAEDLVNRADTLPTLTLKIGDTFKINSKVINNLASLIKTSTFKLRKIKKNLAYFNIKQEFSIDKSKSKLNAMVNGSGKGKYIFNLDHKCFVSEKSWYKVLVILNMDDYKLTQEMSQKSSESSQVANN